MNFRLEPLSPVPIYAQIVSQVRGAVAGGDLRAGDSLPSVRQLAGELRVNPNTVAQAYRELEREGITFVQRGQGTFVADLPAERRREERAEAGRQAVARMLREALRLGIPADELRLLVEEGLRRPPADTAPATEPGPRMETGPPMEAGPTTTMEPLENAG